MKQSFQTRSFPCLPIFALACCFTVAFALTKAPADDKTQDKADDKARAQLAADKKALAPVQSFVGTWRGVGIPDRSKSEGTWGENAKWAWSFEGGRAAIVFDAADAQIYKTGKLLAGDQTKEGTQRFTFTGTLPDGKTTESFTGQINDDGQLVLDAVKPEKDRPAQITLRTVAKGARLIVLYLKPSPIGGNNLVRMAEVGYTRKGSGFGVAQKDNECIVTGGESDIKVEYMGKSYYVCCTGCLDEFKENPEKILAEFKERKEEEAKKRAKEDK